MNGIPGNAGGGGGGGVESIVPIVILGLVLSLGAWMALRHQIVNVSIAVLRAEAVVIEPVIEIFGSKKQQDSFARWQHQLATAPSVMPPGRLVRGISAGGQWIRWPVALGMVLLAIWVYRRSPITRYSRTMDFEGLLQEQQQSFPRIRPVLWLKKKLYDKDRGAYTWALSPYELCARNGVIMASPDRYAVEASFDDAKAERVLSSQLGPAFQGASALPYHMQILFAAIGARCIDERDPSEVILDAAGAGFQPVGWSRGFAATLRQWQGRQWDWPANGPFEIILSRSVDKLVATTLVKVENHTRIQQIIARHHHASAVLAAMLKLARERQGTITSSDFIWLKAVDRTLHYVLNDVGRRVACAEAAGVRSHMQFEQAFGRCAEPRVSAAVDSIRKHLAECGWEAPPSFEYDEEEIARATAAASELRLRLATGDEAPHPDDPTPSTTSTTGSGGSGGFGAGMASAPTAGVQPESTSTMAPPPASLGESDWFSAAMGQHHKPPRQDG